MFRQLLESVRAHPGQVQQIEQMSMAAVYFLCDPSSLVSMEGGFSFCRALSTLTGSIVASAERFNLNDKLLLATQLMNDVQCLLELLARGSLSHDAAWRVVASITILRSLLSLMQKRHKLSSFAQLKWIPKAPTSLARQLGADDSAFPRLTIPRVSSSSTGVSGRRLHATWQDALELLLELFFSFRPLLWVLLVANRRQLNWKSWRAMTLAEVSAALLSLLVERTKAPIISAMDVGDEEQAARVTGSAAESSASGMRLANVVFCLTRDPFFHIALRQLVKDKLVNGCINRIPLIGALVASQTSYCLAMQESSFLFSMGNFNL